MFSVLDLPGKKLVGKVWMSHHACKSWVKVTKHHCTSRGGKRIFESFRTKRRSGSKWLIHYRTIRLRRGYQVQCVSCKSIKLYYYYRLLNVVYFNNPSTFAVTSKCGGLAICLSLNPLTVKGTKNRVGVSWIPIRTA